MRVLALALNTVIVSCTCRLSDDVRTMLRLNDKKTRCIIIIMQRFHQDDLVGHVLERENWEVLSFPAIAEEDGHWGLGSRLRLWPQSQFC